MTTTSRHILKNKLRDTSGASIVIALLFFLICAVVGATVLTAATINSQATATYKNTRQHEYTVSSAANLVGNELQEGAHLEWDWSLLVNGAPQVSVTGSELLEQLWAHNADIWKEREQNKPFTLGSEASNRIQITGIDGVETVYAQIEITRSFDIYVYLSRNLDPTASAAYDEIVYLQCKPTYTNEGNLIAAEWEPAVITKGSATGGTP